MKSLQEYLDDAAVAHGHLCAGQVLGVRMAMFGLKKLGLEDPQGKDRKRIVTFVEIDRCATDAVWSLPAAVWASALSSFATGARLPLPLLMWKQARPCAWPHANLPRPWPKACTLKLKARTSSRCWPIEK